MKKQETIEDIARWLRSKPVVFGFGETAKLADRIEAAWKCERADAIKTAMMKKCEVCPQSKEGNAAAMREACVKALEELERFHKCDDARLHFADIVHVGNAKRELQEAIKKPPCNCDVGTAEEQAKRFDVFCNSHFVQDNNGGDCSRCPLSSRETWSCQLKWSQMPYEEGAENGKV